MRCFKIFPIHFLLVMISVVVGIHYYTFIDTVGRLFSRTAIFADFENFLFYMKIVSPKYNIYARINHDHISGDP